MNISLYLFFKMCTWLSNISFYYYHSFSFRLFLFFYNNSEKDFFLYKYLSLSLITSPAQILLNRIIASKVINILMLLIKITQLVFRNSLLIQICTSNSCFSYHCKKGLFFKIIYYCYRKKIIIYIIRFLLLWKDTFSRNHVLAFTYSLL